METLDGGSMRRAVRDRVKIAIRYRDGDGRASSRTIWPIFIAYMEEVRIVVAWCEMRQGFRHFRTDRIDSADVTTERIPEQRHALLKRWKALQNQSRVVAQDSVDSSPIARAARIGF